MVRLLFREKPAERARQGPEEPADKRTFMHQVFRRLLAMATIALVRKYKRDAISLVKIEAVSLYVKALGKMRMALIGMIGLSCVLLLLLGGFVLLHVGLFYLIPWPVWVKSLILFLLGVVYFVVALSVILVAVSQKTWMKYSQASRMVAEVTKPQDQAHSH